MTPEQLAALPGAVERLRRMADQPIPADVALRVYAVNQPDLSLVLEGLAMAATYITGGWSQEPLEVDDIATGKREIAVMCKGCIAVLAADEEGPIKHKKECFIPAFKQLAAALAMQGLLANASRTQPPRHAQEALEAVEAADALITELNKGVEE